MGKTYNVNFETGGHIVSDFKIEATNLREARSLAQMHKRQYAREQSKVITKGPLKTIVTLSK